MPNTLQELGAGIWCVIHRITYLYHKGVLLKEQTNNMLFVIIQTIPCSRCIAKSMTHYETNIQNDNLFEVWWKHHNEVNMSKGTEQFEFQEALAKARLKCSNNEIIGVRHILFNTSIAQLHRIITKLLPE